MRDLCSLQYSLFEEIGEDNTKEIEQKFIKELFSDLSQEIEKGTDLSPYLTVSLRTKEEEYVIQLKLPIRSDIFDSGQSD